MRLFYYFGDKFGLKKNHFEFECTYAWTVVGMMVLVALTFCIPALTVMGCLHYIFGVENLNSWPTYALSALFYLVLFEESLHVLERFFKIFNKTKDFILMLIVRTIDLIVKAIDSSIYFFLNRFCKRIEK